MTELAIKAEQAPVQTEVVGGNAEPARVFSRDHLTWTGYALYGYWSYLWGAFGVVVPYLRNQFHLDYSTSALHFSALAAGPFLAGFFGERITGSLGLTKTVYLGNAIMMLGALLLVFGVNAPCTIGGAFFIGLGGNICCQATMASMANRFGEQRALGIAEIQIAGTICCLLAPISVAIKNGPDWRTVIFISGALFVVYFATGIGAMKKFGARVQKKKEHHASRGKLPAAYWVYFAIIFFSVASEWSVAFWVSEYLAQVLHINAADAAIGMSTLLGSMFVGRVIGVKILHLMPVLRLAAISACMAAVGFLIFWLSRDLYLSLFGLVVLGLGEANVYPLCYAQAIGIAGEATEAAAARMSLSSGGAILVAPLLLGMAADSFGMYNACSIVAVCLVVAAAALIFAKPHTKPNNLAESVE